MKTVELRNKPVSAIDYLPSVHSTDILNSPTVNAQNTSAEPPSDLQLEIAHLLLIDVVGYSKLLVNEQIELLQKLNHIVRETQSFRAAEANDKLIRVPTGDGMALLFYRSPEEPVCCALEISKALQDDPSSGCGWAFTAVRSIASRMLTTKPTSLGQESMWPSAC